MTIEELLARESIRQTIVNYTMAGDRVRVDEFIALFTEDAIFETDGVAEHEAFRNVGRAQIRSWFTRWDHRKEGVTKVHQSSFIRHHLSTCQIELTSPTTAKSRTYWVAYTDVGADHFGYYIDAFRKEGDKWLIAHRRIRKDWSSPNSLYTTAVENLRKKA